MRLPARKEEALCSVAASPLELGDFRGRTVCLYGRKKVQAKFKRSHDSPSVDFGIQLPCFGLGGKGCDHFPQLEQTHFS